MAQSNSALQRHETVRSGKAVHACKPRGGVAHRGAQQRPPAALDASIVISAAWPEQRGQNLLCCTCP